MSFWCSSSDGRNWTWAWDPYFGAWLMVGALVAFAAWWSVRGRHTVVLAEGPSNDEVLHPDATQGQGETRGTSRTRTLSFLLGALGLWAVLDWPLAKLGAGYVATAQMARQLIMVMAVAPLLLFATPAALAVRMVGWGRRLTVLRWLARPRVAVPVAALSLVAVNTPVVVDPLVASPFGAFAMDLVWIIAGFVLWMPVQCPHPGVRRLTGAGVLVYLIGQSIIPVLPGFFMTWADYPLYATYELAPRAFEGFGAVDDQQAAAAVLQVGSMIFLWFQIVYRFLRWGYNQMEKNGSSSRPLPTPSV